MKLSYRDKVILIAVIIVAILTAGFFIVIKPKIAEVNSANQQLTEKQKELDDLKAKLLRLISLSKP